MGETCLVAGGNLLRSCYLFSCKAEDSQPEALDPQAGCWVADSFSTRQQRGHGPDRLFLPNAKCHAFPHLLFLVDEIHSSEDRRGFVKGSLVRTSYLTQVPCLEEQVILLCFVMGLVEHYWMFLSTAFRHNCNLTLHLSSNPLTDRKLTRNGYCSSMLESCNFTHIPCKSQSTARALLGTTGHLDVNLREQYHGIEKTTHAGTLESLMRGVLHGPVTPQGWW